MSMHFKKGYSLLLIILFVLSFSLSAFDGMQDNSLVLVKASPLNNLIRCYKSGLTGKKILLIGSIHGDEKAGILLSVKVLNEIFAGRLNKNTLICIPAANPDGNMLNTRTNSNKIDINRNFPAANWVLVDSATMKKDKKRYWGGMATASEIETRFILKVDSIYNPSAIIILHQFLDCVQYDGTGRPLAEFIAGITGQKLLDNIGYKTEGSIGSYFGDDKKKEVITIEIPENPPDSLQQNIVKALVDVVQKGY